MPPGMACYRPVAPIVASAEEDFSATDAMREPMNGQSNPRPSEGKDGDEFPTEYTKWSVDRENVPRIPPRHPTRKDR
jgi:hypothetical protein